MQRTDVEAEEFLHQFKQDNVQGGEDCRPWFTVETNTSVPIWLRS